MSFEKLDRNGFLGTIAWARWRSESTSSYAKWWFHQWHANWDFALAGTRGEVANWANEVPTPYFRFELSGYTLKCILYRKHHRLENSKITMLFMIENNYVLNFFGRILFECWDNRYFWFSCVVFYYEVPYYFRTHFESAEMAAGLQLSVTGVLGFRTVHQVHIVNCMITIFHDTLLWILKHVILDIGRTKGTKGTCYEHKFNK